MHFYDLNAAAVTYLKDKLSHIRGTFVGRSRGTFEAMQVVASEHKISTKNHKNTVLKVG